MKTLYYTATSLDGFIATEDDSLDWLFPLGNINDTSYPAFIADVGALAMGSSTYEWMLRHAASVEAQMGTTWPYSQPTWVFSSRRLPCVEGAKLFFRLGKEVQHRAGDNALLGVNLNRLHLFDKQSTRSLVWH